MSARDLILFGTESPTSTSRALKAGQLTAVLEDGQLRRICWDGREAIRGISFLIRNQNWGTYPARLANLHVEESPKGFRVTYTGHCQDDEQSLQYTVEIVGNAEGSVQFQARLSPITDFSTNRAGFIVLHPLNGVAGESVSVLHTDGRTVQTSFPKHIAPSQPLFDIRAVTHQVCPGVSVTCTMQGDAFELEDQRNWSDASFKTYIRPLSKPYPYVLKAHEELLQSVSLQFNQVTSKPSTIIGVSNERTVRFAAGSNRFPALAMTADSESLSETSLTRTEFALRSLAPQWLVGRVTVESSSKELQRLARAQSVAGAQLWLEVIVSCEGDLSSELLQISQVLRESGLNPSAITVCPHALLKSVPANHSVPGLKEGGLRSLFETARRAFPGALVGGGSVAYFTELNRNPPPPSTVDFITHTTCPIIHAADDDSVMETLESLPWIFESTRHLGVSAEYWLGPTTIGMRHNPYGAAPAQNPQHLRLAMAKDDPRQRSLFGAAFYLAYAVQAVNAGLAVMAFCDPDGPFGVTIEAPGSSLCAPVFHALKWLSHAAHNLTLKVDVDGPKGVSALGYTHHGTNILLLANTTCTPQEVSIANVDHLHLLVLDESSHQEALHAASWSEQRGTRVGPRFVLQPYAVAKAILP
jgi:D-apionolactonase